MTTRPYTGIWPVAPTPFHDDGRVDLDGMRRVIDCMVDQGVDGICILANFSEQFLLSDDERAQLTRASLEQAAGRVPVIVTISHFATQVVEDRAAEAAAMGAAMVMMMPPYHGAILRADEQGIFEHFQRAGRAGNIPIMIQDAPMAGTTLSIPFLVRMAREIEQVKLFKIETPQTAAKLRALIEAGGDAIEGPFDGEEAITLIADMDAGATGTMTSATLPDLIKPAVTAHLSGDRQTARAIYRDLLPLINYENRQCGWRSCKVVMKEGGVIGSDAVRHPTRPMHPAQRAELLELAREVNPLALSWGR
ncbi:dihydrodipicolinate synthase family protein [Rhodobacteraceae bacterium 2CG4]|uniref:Dihydrodipicolinate synthase family protein n=1 Tax=Halovulum marinum TaxID=2662447 RepID=A0A6L5Z2F1_9RHOB|nr:dihydrodipicolinate synthase family protein [Halovulum marinum]MSU90194.1 dihydrodipicolinate synthase family protein [Halovulum marinum]